MGAVIDSNHPFQSTNKNKQTKTFDEMTNAQLYSTVMQTHFSIMALL